MFIFKSCFQEKIYLVSYRLTVYIPRSVDSYMFAVQLLWFNSNQIMIS